MLIYDFSLQVDKMFEHIQQFNCLPEDSLSFDITVNGNRGIYLREPYQVNKKQSEFVVRITPKFYSPGR